MNLIYLRIVLSNKPPNGLAPSLTSGVSMETMVDTTQVPEEEHKFCFAGTVNPKVTLGIQNIPKKKNQNSDNDEDDEDEDDVLWLDLQQYFGSDFYLAQVEWLEDNSGLVVQLLDRKQQNLALVLFDVETG